MATEKNICVLLIMFASLLAKDTPTDTAENTPVDTPLMCYWSADDCERLQTHPLFEFNCDRMNHMYDNKVYSCWVKCQDPGYLCDHDYCEGYRRNCSSTSTSVPTTPTTTQPETTESQTTTASPVPDSWTTTTVDLKPVTTDDSRQQTTDDSRQQTTDDIPTIKNVNDEEKRNDRWSTYEMITIFMNAFICIMMTFIVLDRFVFHKGNCCFRSCGVRDDETGDGGRRASSKTRRHTPPAAVYHKNESYHGNEEECAVLIDPAGEQLQVAVNQPHQDDEPEPEVFTNPAAQQSAVSTETSANPEQTAAQPFSGHQRQTSVTESNDGDEPVTIDQPTVEHLIRTVEQLTKRCTRLFKALENIPPSISRRSSVQLPTVDEQTSNEQKPNQTIGGVDVSHDDLKTLDNGPLTDNMVTALVKKVADAAVESCVTRVLSFDEDVPEDLTNIDVVFCLRHTETEQEETAHVYLEIIEVKEKHVHVCHSCGDDLEDLRRVVERQLSGYTVTNDTITTDHLDDTKSCGLFTIMHVEKYLTAVEGGHYRTGQESAHHLSFTTKGGSCDPNDYRKQLCQLINYSPTTK